jgi:hypothetical protein
MEERKMIARIICMLIVVVALVFTGCSRSQDDIIKQCQERDVANCAREKCIYDSLNGFTGYDIARANYYECMYLNELKKDRTFVSS